jgi:thioesterase domain-containing protein
MELAARAYGRGASRFPVILLDTPHPSVVPGQMRDPDATTLLHAMFGVLLGLDLAQLQQLPESAVIRHLYDRAVGQRLLPPDASLEHWERVLQVAQAHSRLLPPPVRYDFSVSLLRAREGATRFSNLPDLGWAQHAASVSVAWVDGSHETMLESRHAERVARLIADHLSKPIAIS